MKPHMKIISRETDTAAQVTRALKPDWIVGGMKDYIHNKRGIKSRPNLIAELEKLKRI